MIRPPKIARVLGVGLGALLLCSSSAFAADQSQSTNDLWDVSQGTIVIATSGIRGGFAADDMFGGNFFGSEPGNTVFADGQPAGFTHYIEWQTLTPVQVGTFVLFAGGDGPMYNNEREFDRLVLKAKPPGATDFDVILCDYVPPHPYPMLDPATVPLLITNVVPVTARDFRAEFVQYNAGRGLDGPRIIELDAFLPGCVPAPPGLAAWWRGEGDGTDAIGDNDGTPVSDLQYASGKVARAFMLDGIDDEVSIPASPSLNVRSFTVEGWINPSDVAQQRPVVEWCATNDYAGVHLWISVVPQGGGSLPGTLWANVRDTANGTHLLTSAPGLIGPNQWSHVALYDEASGSARLFLNGATVASADLGTFVPKTGVPLHLGRRPTSCYETWPSMLPFAGRLDEISLYDRALSPTEIQVVFSAGSAGKCPPSPIPSFVVADWTFEEGVPGASVTSVIDRSGNDHGGSIIIGNPTFAVSPPSAQGRGEVSLALRSTSGFRPEDSAAFNSGDVFTLEAQVMPGANNDGPWGRLLISGFNPAIGAIILGLGYRGEDHMAVLGDITAPIPQDGASHHVAAVYSRPSLALYLDGQLAGTMTYEYAFPPAGEPVRVAVATTMVRSGLAA